MSQNNTSTDHRPSRFNAVAEVFCVFLKLGLISFGGPVAHLGYFRNELVVRRKWISESGYADLVALCQFMPGPASSQVTFALGVLRGNGLAGGLAASLAFTLPSAFVLIGFAMSTSFLQGDFASGFLHGLKLVAVAIVAQAVWGMAKSLTPDKTRAAIALMAIAIVVFASGAMAQIAAIGAGALAGLWLCRENMKNSTGQLRFPVSPLNGSIALALFLVLLIILPLLATADNYQGLALFDGFYRAGALVFGGGHVVLPLLETQTVATGWISNEAFLTGYGLAQAVPGPLFTFAAYLGAVMPASPNGFTGAMIALSAIFLPGLLLVYGMLPFWDRLRLQPAAQAAMSGANAAVVGILGAALYDPVWTSAVQTSSDFLLALSGFLLLTIWRIQPWLVVLLLGFSSAVFTLI